MKLFGDKVRFFLLLAAILLGGCGDGGDLVATSNGTTLGPGSMTFNFVRAQSTLQVPTETTRIRFRFYSGAGGSGTLLQEETRPFVASITISPVNTGTRSVVIVALDSDGFPVLQATVNVTPVLGQVVTVNFDSATIVQVTAIELRVSPSSASVSVGGTQPFSASLSFSNGDIFPANNVAWSSTGQGTVDGTSGLFTGTDDGVATVTATRNTLTNSVQVVVGTGILTIPQISLDTGNLTFDVNDGPQRISTFATVSDNLDPVVTGTLTFGQSGMVTDAIFATPSTPVIGTVTGSGTSSVSVSLANASLADVQSFINNVTIRYGGAPGSKGTGVINVSLTDQDGETGNASRNFEIEPLNLEVTDTPTGPDQFATIGAALAEISGMPTADTGADGSTITVLADYTTREAPTVIDDPDLRGVTLIGIGSGQSAGVEPTPARQGTRLVALFVCIDGVTVDGFDFFEAGATESLIVDTPDLTVRNCLFTDLGGIEAFGGAGNMTVQNCGFTGVGGNGIFLDNTAAGASFTGNRFENKNVGIRLHGTTGVAITGNGFSLNATNHILVADTIATVSNNDIGNDGATVETSGTANLNAQSNWWGQAAGPQAGQTSIGGASSLDVTNFLTTDPFLAFP